MRIRQINRLRRRKSLLFVNKKKQKNFVNLGFADLSMVGFDPFGQKFFASFFQKRCFLSRLEPRA